MKAVAYVVAHPIPPMLACMAVLAPFAFGETVTVFNMPPGYSIVQMNNSGKMMGIASCTLNTSCTFIRDVDERITLFDAVPGSTLTWGRSMNDDGDIAGIYVHPATSYWLHGFIRNSNGDIATFASPSYPGNIQPLAISNNGTVAGVFDANGFGSTTSAFVRDKSGSITTLPLPTGFEVMAMNSRGDIVGHVGNPNYPEGAYLFDHNKRMTALMINGMPITEAISINESGDITGSYRDPSTGYTRAYVRKFSGAIITFDATTQNVSRTAPRAINARGDVAGNWNPIPLNFRGFFRDHKGAIEVFGGPDATRTSVLSLNNRGDVVGWFYTAQGEAHYFLRTR